MSYTLGIDIGTYESKGVLVNPDGDIVAQAARAHRMQVPEPGWAEHDPEEDWWGDFVHVCQLLLHESGIDPEAIKAVGCSAIGPCMLPVDKDGRALMNGVLYGVDNRAAAEVTELTDAIGEDVLVARCGSALTSQSVGPKILWLRRNRPEIFAETAMIHTSTTFIVHKLTGRHVMDHYTAANLAPLWTSDRLGWTTELADHIIEPERLPELLWSAEFAGEVTADAAAETGLAIGTPVLTGTIDAAAEALSVGVAAPGQMMIMYGSTIFIIMPTAQQVQDPRLWYAPWMLQGLHTSLAGLSTSGTLTHWFRDQLAKDLLREDAFSVLAAEAEASPPGARGLLVHPYFSGERTPIHDPEAKGTIFGLNLTHTRGDIYRAVLEGIAFATGHILQTYAEANAPPQQLLAVGGGTKNDVWLQATSDICGMAQVVRRRTVGASYGNAFLAALALGDVKEADIERWNPVERRIQPIAANTALYKERLELFKELYNTAGGLMRALS